MTTLLQALAGSAAALGFVGLLVWALEPRLIWMRHRRDPYAEFVARVKEDAADERQPVDLFSSYGEFEGDGGAPRGRFDGGRRG